MTHVKPTPEGFRVALDALLHDAGRWDGGAGPGSSQHLREAADAAANLGISAGAWSNFWQAKLTYEETQLTFVNISTEGSAVHHAMGEDLRLARAVYLRADQAALHDVNQTW